MTEAQARALLNRQDKTVRRLYQAAQAERWSLEPALFVGALVVSAVHRFREELPTEREFTTYLESLHVEDLALATACLSGHGPAWDHFVQQFRPRLYASARSIAGEHDSRELADSLYAELYGLDTGDPVRRSLFRYFHGRSSLATWLRAVLAQRHVDAVRTRRRMDPLDAEPQHPIDSEDVRMDLDRSRLIDLLQAAVSSAIIGLNPRDRLRLSCYYVQDLTLAQIGRLLGEHEATVSRKLEKTRKAIRATVERRLRGVERLTDEQVRLCFEYATEKWPFDLTGALTEPER